MSGPAVRARTAVALTAVALTAALGVAQPEVAPEPRPVSTPTPAPPAAPTDPFVIDADRLHFSRVEDDAKVRSEAENPHEFTAYNEVLLHARRFPAAELEKRANADVMWRDLVEPVRKDYQFKLLLIEGRLKRLRRMEPTRPLAEQGVTDVYEGWLFPHRGSEPLCVLTTELPEGLKASKDDFDPARPVVVAAYSFKLFRYYGEAADAKDPERQQVRRAPLLMGRAFRLVPEPPAPTGDAWRDGFLPGMLGLLAGVTAVALGLTWWFRRGDRRVRRTATAPNPFETPT